MVKNLDDLIKEATILAEVVSDGHFTLMRFTTNWRFAFKTIEDGETIQVMYVADTAEEVLEKAIKDVKTLIKNWRLSKDLPPPKEFRV